ncbi:hypothetical protein L198_04070 [Cryptococcus wingfieldii CBS 7118]|uniref:Integrase core domain-containing protein n=1 Tax=Cryptococcus wingfieldii CBS 7118 TaxID=1295528 RepID=A0A1E3J8E0_9TREE|nr:hypothetical protein L198_04070 [Cryptococcus wingfieldii CBS 7118]ODN96356.1 hypothetical protein L198_04070 [Cryptococcus wingfieldii CBS 7118]
MADRSRYQEAPPPHPDLLAFVQDLYDQGITNWRDVNTRLEQDESPWTFGSKSTFRRWRDKHGVSRPGPHYLQPLPYPSDHAIAEKIVALGRGFQSSGSRVIKAALSLEGMVVGEKRLRPIIKELYPDRAAGRIFGKRNIPRRPIGLFNGANEQWSGDGHDKLRDWGFCFYGWRDVYSGQIIIMSLLPSNRDPQNTLWADLSLLLCPGFPRQIATDRGSETDQFSGTHAWLRQNYGQEVSPLIPVHRYLKSTHNITIERCWRGLIKHVIEPVGEVIAQGREEGGFVSTNDAHIRVFWFLFIPLVTDSLNKFIILHNHYKVRYQREKHNPSGCRRIDVWKRPEDFGGEQHLIPLTDEARGILEVWSADAYREGQMQWLTPAEYNICTAGLETLGWTERWSYEDVWALFSRLIAVVIDDLYLELQRQSEEVDTD